MNLCKARRTQPSSRSHSDRISKKTDLDDSAGCDGAAAPHLLGDSVAKVDWLCLTDSTTIQAEPTCRSIEPLWRSEVGRCLIKASVTPCRSPATPRLSHDLYLLSDSGKIALVKHDYIRTQSDLERICQQLKGVPRIAFDTEFVSEDTYRPDLCLIQVAAEGVLAVIDPKEVDSVAPFWDVLAGGEHETIVHAGREEFRFCLHDTGKWPAGLFDTQIAAGLIGLEYPAAYGKLLSKLLDRSLAKGETRTDWRRRPLSDRQIEYALQDVLYLEELYESIDAKLQKWNRRAWLDDEMKQWQQELENFENRENWRRVSGTSGLSEKAMVIVRELWRWRERQAQQQNRPPRRVLRDDLIVELARRGKSEVKQIQAIRGIDRTVAKRHFPEIAEAIRAALELPKSEWPKIKRSRTSNQPSLVGQFIATALSTVCRTQNLAPSLVGTVQDVRDLVDYRLSQSADDEVPALATGWRSEVVGRTLDDVLEGRTAIRIRDPKSDNPLSFEPIS
ncbi:MAG: ribonuclease D [Planctomycetaceae bacterium]|nr:ribonuclease D [Planctomycetaceae bacterium]